MNRWGETLLGAIVVIVAVGFFAFASAQAGQTGGHAGYDLSALFNRVDGITVGSDVRVSGVKVGAVKAISLDTENAFQAKLTFTIDNNIHLDDQSTARIQSDGLLGGAYVSIEPGGGTPLPPGGMIENTQGTVDLLSLFATMAGGGNRSNDTTQGAPTP